MSVFNLFSGQIFFVTWREAFEAVLIVGILYAYLRQANVLNGVKYMWAGVGIGILFSGVLGWGILKAQVLFVDTNQVLFNFAILFFSAILMTQMVFWMNMRGRYIKSDLEKGIQTALKRSSLAGVAALAALAIAREGSETVIFIYGLTLGGNHTVISIVFSFLAGLSAAALLAWAFSRGLRYFNQKLFFKLTSAFLLFTASGILMTAFGQLVAADLINPLVQPLWNSSSWLPTDSIVAAMMRMLFAYNPQPSLTEVLSVVVYWSCVILIFNFDRLKTIVNFSSTSVKAS